MEAAVLLGLVAVGYFKNKENNGDNPIITNVKSDVKLTNGENIYDSGNYYQETKKEVNDLVKEKFNKSIKPGPIMRLDFFSKLILLVNLLFFKVPSKLPSIFFRTLENNWMPSKLNASNQLIIYAASSSAP